MFYNGYFYTSFWTYNKVKVGEISKIKKMYISPKMNFYFYEIVNHHTKTKQQQNNKNNNNGRDTYTYRIPRNPLNIFKIN